MPLEFAGRRIDMCLNGGCSGKTVVIGDPELQRFCDGSGIPKERLAEEEFRAWTETAILAEAVTALIGPDFASALASVPDESLCSLLHSALKGDGLVFADAAHAVPAAARHLIDVLRSGPDFASVVIGILLAAEFDKRRNLKETAAGRLIRKWLVAKDELTKDEADELTRICQFRRRYNADAVGEDKRKSSAEENDSVLWEGLCDAARELDIDGERALALSYDGLKKLLSAPFNKVARRADNILRNYVDTAARRSNTKDGVEDEADFPVELVVATPDCVILAEILAGAGLTPRERQVIELTMEELTQKEIAKKLAVSQPRVNQLLDTAIMKCQQVVRSTL